MDEVVLILEQEADKYGLAAMREQSLIDRTLKSTGVYTGTFSSVPFNKQKERNFKKAINILKKNWNNE